MEPQVDLGISGQPPLRLVLLDGAWEFWADCHKAKSLASIALNEMQIPESSPRVVNRVCGIPTSTAQWSWGSHLLSIHLHNKSLSIVALPTSQIFPSPESSELWSSLMPGVPIWGRRMLYSHTHLALCHSVLSFILRCLWPVAWPHPRPLSPKLH